MSDNVKSPSVPKRRSTPYSPGYSLDDFQKMSEIFKSWVDDTKLKWWIIAAGVGAILESLHIVWLAARYVFRF
jgi:hypothetical protein